MCYQYSVETFSCDIPVDEYITHFRDEEKFLEMCKMCPNYGNSWSCPPFDFDTEEVFRSYRYAHLIATKIIPFSKNIPINDTQKLIHPERVKIEKRILEMERKSGGRGFSYIGKCLYCEEGICTRKCGKPCLHPEKVRPSLEAFGFDIELTLKKLFGMEILWSKNGMVPEYLILVSALFHN